MLSVLERILFAIDWLLSRVAASVILAVMVLIVCDVFGRYLFSRPLPWVYDIVSIYVVNLVMYFLAFQPPAAAPVERAAGPCLALRRRSAGPCVLAGVDFNER
jgi:hypothetical protein